MARIAKTMSRYLLLNSLVLLLPVGYALLFRRDIFTKRWLVILIIMLLLTAIFDNFIIMANIVAYRPEHILGWYIYRAPIEDFFYTVAVVVLIPLLWGQDETKH